MAKLVYSVIASLDGYTVDADGSFAWAAPDAEVHACINDQERTVGTYLYGRRMYETMVAWETMPVGAGTPPAVADFAQVWRAADKVVYSSTLAAVASDRTRIERAFDPEAVARLKAAADRDVSVGGPGLAAAALRAGLVDECHLFVVPHVVGGGTRWLPDGLRADLQLLTSTASAGAPCTCTTASPCRRDAVRQGGVRRWARRGHPARWCRGQAPAHARRGRPRCDRATQRQRVLRDVGDGAGVEDLAGHAGVDGGREHGVLDRRVVEAMIVGNVR